MFLLPRAEGFFLGTEKKKKKNFRFFFLFYISSLASFATSRYCAMIKTMKPPAPLSDPKKSQQQKQRKMMRGAFGAFVSRIRSSSFEHVVLGNEACDMDSCVSSLVFAFLLSEQSGVLHAPVLNVCAGDLCLRTDVVRLLEQTNVSANDLLFVDQPDLNLSGKLLHLVDHNRLAAAQEHLEPRVVEILDHHRDDGKCANASPREIVFPLGSCCTLVAKHVLAHEGGSLLKADASLARLLLAPILIDTGNLDKALGKTEPLDAQMAAALEPLACLTQSKDAFFHALNDAKFDVSRLSMRDLLRRDYKEFVAGARRVGMSAVLRSLTEVNAAEMNAAVGQWMVEQRLDVLVVMTAYYRGPEKAFERQDWIVAREQGLGEALARRLVGEATLNLRPLPAGTVLQGHAFQQLDVRPSRKQLAPMVTDFLESSKL